MSDELNTPPVSARGIRTQDELSAPQSIKSIADLSSENIARMGSAGDEDVRIFVSLRNWTDWATDKDNPDGIPVNSGDKVTEIRLKANGHLNWIDQQKKDGIPRLNLVTTVSKKKYDEIGESVVDFV
jgi:hypothetical protein